MKARLERVSAAMTAAVGALCGIFALNDLAIGVFQDDGHYAILARALATGHGYHYTNLPGAPAATHFPPGYPLLLAPLWWIAPSFPGNVAVLKLLNVVLLAVAAVAIRAVARRLGGLSPLAASMLAMVSVATVPVLFLSGLLFSEIAFIAALCGVLLVAEPVVAHEDASWRRVLGVGVAIGALAMLRTVGVTLLPAVLAVLLWRRRWQASALVLAGACVFLVPWQLWSAAHARDVSSAIAGAYGAYGTWLTDAWRAGGAPFVRDVLLENLRGLRMLLMLFGLYDAPLWARAMATLALVTLVASGAWALRRRAPVTVLLFVPYVALLLLWPFPPDRFLWPLWPFTVMLAVAGARALSETSRPAAVRRGARVLAASLAVLLAVWHVRTWPGRSWEEMSRTNARVGRAAAGVVLALPADGLVASDQDAMVALYANRQAVPLVALTAEQHVRARSDEEVSRQIAGVLDAYHPRWVLVVQRESLRGATLLQKAGRLHLMGADPSGVIVYDVLR